MAQAMGNKACESYFPTAMLGFSRGVGERLVVVVELLREGGGRRIEEFESRKERLDFRSFKNCVCWVGVGTCNKSQPGVAGCELT